MLTLQHLRSHAVTHSLFGPTTLKAAIRRMGFVQADPIRSPARAQDLILRHRVKGYRAGDLERKYPALDLEEDYLYAYGFLPRSISQLLHPRTATPLAALDKRVLEAVRDAGAVHPRDLGSHFGRERVVNGWGGFSQATKHVLERLHHRGHLRVTRRENGIRIYEAAPERDAPPPTIDRVRALTMVVANILAPVSERTFQQTLAHVRRWLPVPGGTRAVVNDLVRSGALERHSLDGLTYLWPAGKARHAEATRTVRFLAPFDPLVWDRRRFEHLWGWSYRFEAYTPAAKRIRGYYAMPVLWDQEIIGWANAGIVDNGLNVEVGYVGKRPRDIEFRTELAAEIDRLKMFLDL